jgi:hypothetical protein
MIAQNLRPDSGFAPSVRPGMTQPMPYCSYPEEAMPQVDSSAIRSVHYRAGRRELVVRFVSGRAYVYFDVPAELYCQFLDAPSRGRFFNREIRDRYRFHELTTTGVVASD